MNEGDTMKENNSSPLLEAKDLSISFKMGGEVAHVVHRVSFHIDPGETVAIVGESGSGKSVTALSIIQLLPPNAFHPSGSICYGRQELVGASPRTLQKVRGNRIGMIFQEPQTSLNPLHSILRQISETLIIHKGMSPSEAKDRSLELLEMVGIRNAKSRLNAYPHELSGGQRQRVMIAMALANEPDLLIADEPTTALDVTVQAQILKLLQDLQQKLGMSLLLISHDLNVVQRLADRIYVMRRGQFVEDGTRSKIFKSPTHDYTKMLLESEPSGCSEGPKPHAPIVLEAEAMRVWYPIRKGILRRTVDHIKAVDNINLKLREGETIGIVGESGSGKTSLALALLRLISSQGRICFQGQDIQGRKTKELRELRRRMQIVFQDPYGSLSPRMTVSEIIAEGLRVHETELTQRQRESKVVDVLKEVEIDPKSRHRYPHEFSGGQRQRIAIARAIILKPKFVILDEPTSALDRSVQAQIIELLRSLQRNYDLAYMFISHDLAVVRVLADTVIVLRNGRVVEQGPTEQVYRQPQEAYTKELIAAAMP